MGNKKDKMNYKSIKIAIIGAFIGIILQDIDYHFRFNNPLLREELLLSMQNGNSGYFLTFAFFSTILLLLGVLVIGLLEGKIKFKKTKKNE